MRLLFPVFVFAVVIVFTGCSTIKPQQGGKADVVGKLGTASVQQPDNAETEAGLSYYEDSITLGYGSGEALEIDDRQRVTFLPQEFRQARSSQSQRIRNHR